MTTGAHYLWEMGSTAAAGAASVGGGGGVAVTDHADHAPLESIFSRGAGMLSAAELAVRRPAEDAYIVMALYRYGLYSYGLYSYGLYSYGLYRP